jgi:hypothetical protein
MDMSRISHLRAIHFTGVSLSCGSSACQRALPQVDRRVPGLVRYRCGLPGLPGLATLARQFACPDCGHAGGWRLGMAGTNVPAVAGALR